MNVHKEQVSCIYILLIHSLVVFECDLTNKVNSWSGYHALLSPSYKQTQHSGVFANSPAPAPAMTSFQPGE